MPACAGCAAPAALSCAACAAPYCSPACQRPTHKGACRAAAAARAAATAREAEVTAQADIYAGELTACSQCAAPFAGRAFHECVQCRTAAYCDAACQRAAWGGHKAMCRAAGEAKFAAVVARAEAGDAREMFNVGLNYEYGTGVVANMSEAVKWYTRATETGNASAQFNLALCYKTGLGVVADAGAAFKWYTRAAEAGNVTAQFNLGACYANGAGVARDFVAARSRFMHAAAAGVAEAPLALTQLDALEAAFRSEGRAA